MTGKRKIIDARAVGASDITHVLFDDNNQYTSVDRAKPMADRGEIKNTHVVRLGNAKNSFADNR